MSTRDRATMLEIQYMLLEEVLIQEARELGCNAPSTPAATCENARKAFLAVDRDPGPTVKPRTLH